MKKSSKCWIYSILKYENFSKKLNIHSDSNKPRFEPISFEEVEKEWFFSELFSVCTRGGIYNHFELDRKFLNTMVDKRENNKSNTYFSIRLDENVQKDLSKIFYCYRGQYLLSGVYESRVEIEWYRSQITRRDLEKVNDWRGFGIYFSMLDSNHSLENDHRHKIENNCPEKIQGSLIFLSYNLDNYNTYLAIEGNHRIRTILRTSDNQRETFPIIVGLVGYQEFKKVNNCLSFR